MERAEVVWEATAYADLLAAAAAAAPREACGALLGRGALVTGIVELRNVALGDTEYEIDPKQVAALYALEDTGDIELLGWYHSHPRTSSEPSSVDHDYAVPGYVYAVAGVDGVSTWRVA